MTHTVAELLGGRSVGYAAYSADCSAPGDRRRFVHWARARGVPFALARPGDRFDLTVVSLGADLSWWRRVPRGETRIVFDLTDAYLRIPAGDPRAALRGMAKFVTGQSRYFEASYTRALRAMCRRADAVLCTSQEIKADVARFNSNAHAVLDFVEDVLAEPKTSYAAGTPFRLVWDGLPENVPAFRVVARALAAASKVRALELDAITAPRFHRWMQRFGRRDTRRVLEAILPIPTRLNEWRADRVAHLVPAADAGIIPLPLDDPLRAGKSENKLIQYWRMGLPVVVSATPTHLRVMRDAGVQMACRTEAEWIEVLTRCLTDEPFRREQALRGRAYAEREHSEEQKLARWDAAIGSVFS